MKKIKGLRSAHRWLQDSHGDVKHGIGNIVNNIVITVCGARWELKILGGTLCKVYDCLTTSWTPETNTDYYI